MNAKPRWQAWWIAFDYAFFLPFLARLPVPWGRYIAAVRGRWYARLGRDWRQFSFEDEALRERTRQTYAEFQPHADANAIERMVRQRYVMQSLEELEAAWVVCRDLNDWPVEYVGLEHIQESLKTYGRAVFVTSHFASSIVGTIHLRQLGVPVLGMSSNVVDDPRVHPAIGRFYRKKYAAMRPYLLGGSILDRQGNSREFVKFLKKGGAVVIVGDLPPDAHEQAMEIPFFGKIRGFASGPLRMAGIVQVPLLAYVCEYTGKGYRMTFSEPMQHPYALFEKHIYKNPSAWWAADILLLLPLGKPTEN
jgi:lauroyl/myristoyl acyltransferase